MIQKGAIKVCDSRKKEEGKEEGRGRGTTGEKKRCQKYHDREGKTGNGAALYTRAVTPANRTTTDK